MTTDGLILAWSSNKTDLSTAAAVVNTLPDEPITLDDVIVVVCPIHVHGIGQTMFSVDARSCVTPVGV